MSFRFLRGDTEIRFVTKFGGNRPSRSCRKFVWFTTKKLALRGTCASHHFAQNWPIAPKITSTLSPIDMSTYTEFGPDRLRFAGLIPERLIFRPQKSLSVQCYAWTKYKFTCVCVCPSHFLSTRLQVRPLNGFLQLIA